jgi:Zn-dependent peptidase ImmA (M78 family)
MTQERKRQIKRLVERLLLQASVTKPPVPVDRLAQLSGATLRYVPTEEEDISGVLFREGASVIIGVNALHPKTRQRFTIAHELGHLSLHHESEMHVDRGFRYYARDLRSSQANDIREMEANAFAAELLMPTSLLRKDLERLSVDCEDDRVVQELAARYKVSAQAMTIRLTNLSKFESI